MDKQELISFDYAVMHLLRSKSGYEVLEGFLSELFKRPIKINWILEDEPDAAEMYGNKPNRVDIVAGDGTADLFFVEIQFFYEEPYYHRMIFYENKAMRKYVADGSPYGKAWKVYSVNIAYSDMSAGAEYLFHGKTTLTGLHEHDELQATGSDCGSFGKQAPPEYYILMVNKFDGIVKDPLDEWFYYMKNNEIKESFSAKGIKQAQSILAKSKLGEG